MLESMSKDRRTSAGVHIVYLNNNTDDENLNSIKIGRGSDSEIRISDISVSRCHAKIVFEKDGY